MLAELPAGKSPMKLNQTQPMTLETKNVSLECFYANHRNATFYLFWWEITSTFTLIMGFLHQSQSCGLLKRIFYQITGSFSNNFPVVFFSLRLWVCFLRLGYHTSFSYTEVCRLHFGWHKRENLKWSHNSCRFLFLLLYFFCRFSIFLEWVMVRDGDLWLNDFRWLEHDFLHNSIHATRNKL